MVDHLDDTVCCMCGDVGFPDKLFSCIRCRFRFQHSYCSNYYSTESSNEWAEICDWCRSEGGPNPQNNTTSVYAYSSPSSSSKHGGAPSRKSARSEYVSGQRIKRPEQLGQATPTTTTTAAATTTSGRSPSGVPSPRQTTRRYKLLKDVMC